MIWVVVAIIFVGLIIAGTISSASKRKIQSDIETNNAKIMREHKEKSIAKEYFKDGDWPSQPPS